MTLEPNTTDITPEGNNQDDLEDTPEWNNQDDLEVTPEWNNQDDLGVCGGNTHLENIELARPIVEKWKVVAVGRRPIDHLGRDLLFGSIQRDRRLWRLRTMFKHKPYWMIHDFDGPSESDLLHVVRCRSLHLEQLLHLARIEGDADEIASEVIEKLRRCWPYTLEVRWEGPEERTSHDVCGLGRQCPFCFARQVVDLYSRLNSGPCRDSDDKLLALGILSISDGQFDEDSRWLPPEDRFKFVRIEVGHYLKSFAQRIGIEGGVTSFQVGPQLYVRSGWHANERAIENQQGFQYTLAVLGEITSKADQFLRSISADRQGIVPPPNPLQIAGEPLLPRWSCGRTRDLRRMLVGTAPSYSRNTVPGGHIGAFTLQPWSLANYEQWRSHLDLSRNTRLFDVWGTWRGALPEADRAKKAQGLINAPYRRGVYRRSIAFRSSNERRKTEANSRREALLEQVRPIYAEISEGRDRRPGRVQLQKSLGDRGITVSARDVRWILLQIPRNAG
jgi:hypothetical protein